MRRHCFLPRGVTGELHSGVRVLVSPPVAHGLLDEPDATPVARRGRRSPERELHVKWRLLVQYIGETLKRECGMTVRSAWAAPRGHEQARSFQDLKRPRL